MRNLIRTFAALALATLFAVGGASAQVQQGYYTTPDNGVPHIVKPRNGAIYIDAGGETAIYSNTGGKYVLKGYFYNGNEANMRTPISKNPPYIVPQSNTSYTYHAAGYVKNYSLDATQTRELSILFDTDKLEEHEVYVSTGAACAATKHQTPQSLLALGLTEEATHSHLRLTLGKLNNQKNIAQAARLILDVIAKEQKRLEGLR